MARSSRSKRKSLLTNKSCKIKRKKNHDQPKQKIDLKILGCLRWIEKRKQSVRGCLVFILSGILSVWLGVPETLTTFSSQLLFCSAYFRLGKTGSRFLHLAVALPSICCLCWPAVWLVSLWGEGLSCSDPLDGSCYPRHSDSDPDVGWSPRSRSAKYW